MKRKENKKDNKKDNNKEIETFTNATIDGVSPLSLLSFGFGLEKEKTTYSYGEPELIPTLLNKEKNGYYVLVGDGDEGLIEEKEKGEPIRNSKIEWSPLTQFYIGSLSIVGLYIIFRVLKPSNIK